MQSQRKFGVEIEVGRGTRQAVMDQFVEAGIICRDMNNYHNSSGENWRIVYDGSVEPGGFEVVSPILQGDAGLDEVQKVCKILSRAGARVDRRCGFHVHVDAADLSVDDCKQVAIRYGRYENIIDAFVPPSRRSGGGVHGGASCNNLTNEYAGIRQKTGFRALDRYYKVNLASICKHGTIEFRQHSGTISAEKTRNWIQFCVEFVEASRGSVTTIQETVPAVQPVVSPQSVSRTEFVSVHHLENPCPLLVFQTRSPDGETRRRLSKDQQLVNLANLLTLWSADYTRAETCLPLNTICQYLDITADTAQTYLNTLKRRVSMNLNLYTNPIVVNRDRLGAYIRWGMIDRVKGWVGEESARLAETAAVRPRGMGPVLLRKVKLLAQRLNRDSMGNSQTGLRVRAHVLSQFTGISESSIPGYIQRLRDLTGATITGYVGRYTTLDDLQWLWGDTDPSRVQTALAAYAQRQEASRAARAADNIASTGAPGVEMVTRQREIRTYTTPLHDQWNRGIDTEVANWLRERAGELLQMGATLPVGLMDPVPNA